MVNINKRGCHGRCCTARTCSLRGCLEDASTPEIRKGQILIILYLCSYSNWNTAEKKRLMCSGLCCVAQQDRSLWHNKASRSFVSSFHPYVICRMKCATNGPLANSQVGDRHKLPFCNSDRF